MTTTQSSTTPSNTAPVTTAPTTVPTSTGPTSKAASPGGSVVFRLSDSWALCMSWRPGFAGPARLANVPHVPTGALAQRPKGNIYA